MNNLLPLTNPTPTMNQYQNMMENYASILEKTNNQLGLNINFANLAVTTLSAIIGIIAIIVAVLLWKNSNDQKRNAKVFYKNQEKNINKIIKQYQKQYRAFQENQKRESKKAQKYLNLKIKEYQSKLDTANEKSKKDIQQLIDEFEFKKATLTVASSSVPLPYMSAYSGSVFPMDQYCGSSSIFEMKNTIICKKCSRSFEYLNNSQLLPTSSITFTGRQTYYCPYCGTANIV